MNISSHGADSVVGLIDLELCFNLYKERLSKEHLTIPLDILWNTYSLCHCGVFVFVCAGSPYKELLQRQIKVYLRKYIMQY